MDDAACHPFLNLFSLELGSYISLTNLSSRGHEISTSRTQWRGIYPGSRTAGDASMELQGCSSFWLWNSHRIWGWREEGGTHPAVCCISQGAVRGHAGLMVSSGVRHQSDRLVRKRSGATMEDLPLRDRERGLAKTKNKTKQKYL